MLGEAFKPEARGEIRSLFQAMTLGYRQMSDGFKKDPLVQNFLIFALLSTENPRAPNWRKFTMEIALE